MNTMFLCVAAAAVGLFGGRPVTEKFDIPENVRTNEYVLSFEATFPKGAPRSVKLFQYFPDARNPKSQLEMHTSIGFTAFTRTLGSVVYGKFTGAPWFNGFVDAPVADGETRRVEVVCHANTIAYWVEYGGRMYRTLVDRVYPHYRLAAVQFAELGKPGAEVRISNVKLRPLAAAECPKPRKGYRIAQSPETFTVPVEGDETRFSFIPGGYPVKVAMRFVDGTTNAPSVVLQSFAQTITLSAQMREKLDGQGLALFQKAKTTGSVLWEDSGLTVAGCKAAKEDVTVHTRARIAGRYKGDQIPAILTNETAYGECAAQHAFDFRLVRREGVWQLWIDGDFARFVPAKDVSRIELDVPPAAQIKVLPGRKSLGLSPLVEPLPERAPFAVAKCRENLGSHSLEHDGYRSRQPFERLPDCWLRRVPVGTYVKARVKCRLAGDLKKDTRITARLTNFGINGQANGASPDAMTQQTKTIERVPGKDVYTVDFDFDPGQIQDIIWQWGCESLHFEVLGGVIPTNYFAVRQDKPDEEHPSDVVVLGAELVRAPAGMWIENGGLGNLFYAETETPHVTAHVEALVAGDYELAWKVFDIDGKTVETYKNGMTLAAGGKKSLRREFSSRRPGWYGYVATLTAKDGTRCVVRKGSFVLQPPDTRKAGFDSPYFSWLSWHLARGRTYEEWKPWLAFYRRFGIHKTTAGYYSEEFFRDYPMTVSPLPHLGCSTDPSPEKRRETYEAKVADFKKRFPHATMATVLHENYGGETPLEIVGGVSTIDAKQKENDALWTMRATEMASAYRKLWPGMRLSLGNSGSSLGVAGELYRGKMDKKLIDYVGEEDVGASTPPEVDVAEGFWTIREEARIFGYGHVLPTACYEWKARPRRLFQFRRLQAATKVRDILVAHAWRSPSITVGTGAEPSTCYFTTSWGGGVFTREPLMQPLPDAAANATVTLVLDSCTLKRMVPTGSPTVYCLEFTRGNEFVYALWAARGAVDATIRTKAGKAVRTDLYGASEDKAGWFSSKIATEISEEPSYFTMDRPIESIELAKGSRRYPLMRYAGMEKAETFARFDDPDGVEVLAGKRAPGGFGPARGQLPVVREGVCTAAVVDDEEKGRVVELTLKPEEPLPSPLIKETCFVGLKKPVVIPEGAKTIALDVKGNSTWGKATAMIEDAKGKTFAFEGRGGECYFDSPCSVALNFDGWCRLHLPLKAGSPVRNASIAMNEEQWRCTNGPATTPMTPPLKLTGFGAVMTRKVLNLVEMEDAPSLSIRFAAAAAY